MAKKKVQDQGAQIPRNAAYLAVREIPRNAAQHRYWTFYEAIRVTFCKNGAPAQQIAFYEAIKTVLTKYPGSIMGGDTVKGKGERYKV